MIGLLWAAVFVGAMYRAGERLAAGDWMAVLWLAVGLVAAYKLLRFVNRPHGGFR